jgi:hypothetical protein
MAANCGVRNACAAVIENSAAGAPDAFAVTCGAAGGRRTNSAAGMSNNQATTPMTSMPVRQS